MFVSRKGIEPKHRSKLGLKGIGAFAAPKKIGVEISTIVSVAISTFGLHSHILYLAIQLSLIDRLIDYNPLITVDGA